MKRTNLVAPSLRTKEQYMPRLRIEAIMRAGHSTRVIGHQKEAEEQYELAAAFSTRC
jgi:hypothetical protein